MSRKLMSVREVAKELDLTSGRVYAAIHTGKLTAQLVDGKYMVSPEALKKWRENTMRRYKCLNVPFGEQGTINFRVDRKMLDAARKIAYAQRIPVSMYCRMAIEKQIEEDKKNEF